jgi:glycine amidinotransferase
MQYAANWIGNSKETVFEVNMLVVDEKNIICIAENDAACKRLEALGITPHVVNFKTRGFWDGGIHCITLDINRSGDCIDYWPDRGQNGIYRYSVPSV